MLPSSVVFLRFPSIIINQLFRTKKQIWTFLQNKAEVTNRFSAGHACIVFRFWGIWISRLLWRNLVLYWRWIARLFFENSLFGLPKSRTGGLTWNNDIFKSFSYYKVNTKCEDGWHFCTVIRLLQSFSMVFISAICILIWSNDIAKSGHEF